MTGVGACKDAIDAHGASTPESVVDPLVAEFRRSILLAEVADLVILIGDLLHHDIPGWPFLLTQNISFAD